MHPVRHLVIFNANARELHLCVMDLKPLTVRRARHLLSKVNVNNSRLVLEVIRCSEERLVPDCVDDDDLRSWIEDQLSTPNTAHLGAGSVGLFMPTKEWIFNKAVSVSTQPHDQLFFIDWSLPVYGIIRVN
jgi:hypothetical protein